MKTVHLVVRAGIYSTHDVLHREVISAHIEVETAVLELRCVVDFDWCKSSIYTIFGMLEKQLGEGCQSPYDADRRIGPDIGLPILSHRQRIRFINDAGKRFGDIRRVILKHLKIDGRDISRSYSFSLGLDPISRVKFPGYKILLKDCAVGGSNCIIDNLLAGGGFTRAVPMAVRGIAADFAFVGSVLLLEVMSAEAPYMLGCIMCNGIRLARAYTYITCDGNPIKCDIWFNPQYSVTVRVLDRNRPYSCCQGRKDGEGEERLHRGT